MVTGAAPATRPSTSLGARRGTCPRLSRASRELGVDCTGNHGGGRYCTGTVVSLDVRRSQRLPDGRSRRPVTDQGSVSLSPGGNSRGAVSVAMRVVQYGFPRGNIGLSTPIGRWSLLKLPRGPASATSRTTSPDPSSRPVGSDHNYTLVREEPVVVPVSLASYAGRNVKMKKIGQM